MVRPLRPVARPGRQDGTWITREIREAYAGPAREGYAHSFEAFRDGRLAGGLYGVSLGAAFFGESMFSLESYASRAAFAGSVRDWPGAGASSSSTASCPTTTSGDLGARVVDPGGLPGPPGGGPGGAHPARGPWTDVA